MPNERTLHSFSFFVHFADLKIHTCEFAEKTHLALETVSRSPQFYVDCMMVNTYQLLYIQRSSPGHLNSVLLPSHNAWYIGVIHNAPNPFYSLFLVSLWPNQGLKFFFSSTVARTRNPPNLGTISQVQIVAFLEATKFLNISNLYIFSKKTFL